jgi:hypothetical protein
MTRNMILGVTGVTVLRVCAAYLMAICRVKCETRLAIKLFEFHLFSFEAQFTWQSLRLFVHSTCSKYYLASRDPKKSMQGLSLRRFTYCQTRMGASPSPVSVHRSAEESFRR